MKPCVHFGGVSAVSRYGQFVEGMQLSGRALALCSGGPRFNPQDK